MVFFVSFTLVFSVNVDDDDHGLIFFFIFHSTAAAVSAEEAAEDVTVVRARSVALHSDRLGFLVVAPRAINESARYCTPSY